MPASCLPPPSADGRESLLAAGSFAAAHFNRQVQGGSIPSARTRRRPSPVCGTRRSGAAKLFAAFTAIFAKIGLAGVDSDLATLIRKVIIFGVLGALRLSAARGATIAFVVLRELKRRQPGLSTDRPEFVGGRQLVWGIQ
jgi:hypothetical protein